MNISFQRARTTTTTVSIKLTAVLILSVQLKTFVTSVYNDPYIFHKTIHSTNRKHGVHLTWRDCLGWLLFKLENKQESDSTPSALNNLLYFNSLCTDVPPPPPQEKLGEETSSFFRFFLREGGRLYTGYSDTQAIQIHRYSVFNREPVIIKQ